METAKFSTKVNLGGEDGRSTFNTRYAPGENGQKMATKR
jgi:hypothetical protein